MKKTISLLLMAFLLMGMSGYAQTDAKVILRVTGLGIMQGDENGEFRPDDPITRAEFSAVVTRMKEVEDQAVQQQETGFSDVPKSHWASGYIAIAQSLGIVNGMGDGTFAPESNVTYTDAAKMLVSALGYDVMAKEQGGYPLGYLTTAGSLGITKNVKVGDGQALRGEIATMVYNALDVVPLEVRYGEDGYQKNEENKTLYEILTEKKDMVRVRGVLNETEYTSLLNELPKVKAGYAVIGEQNYKTDVDLTQYVGYYVEGYARRDEGDDLYALKTLAPVESRNTVVTADAEDAAFYPDRLEVEREDGKKERTSIALDAKYIFNGRFIPSPADADKNIPYGSYTLVDNNNDDEAEVVFIQSAESFIVDKVNTGNFTVYFANKQTFRGKNGLHFDYDNQDNQYRIENMEGKALKLEDIQPGNGITLMASKDESLVKAVISTEAVSGRIDSIFDGDTVTIGGKEYKLAKNANGGNDLNPKIGDDATYVLDMFGNIIGVDGSKKRDFHYGYIVNAGSESGVGANMQIEIVSGLKPEKEVKVESGDQKLYYYFQNDEMKTYTLDQKIKLNNVSKSAGSISSSELKGKVAAFSLNSAGLVKELITYDLTEATAQKNCEFNAEILSFGGESVKRGFATNEQTVFVNVPKDVNDKEKSKDDYYVRVKLADESTGHKVFGVTVFPDYIPGDPNSDEYKTKLYAQPVNILVLMSDMDAATPPTIQEDDDICIVGKVTTAIGDIRDDAGAMVYQMELLNKDKVVTEVTTSSGAAFETASKLRKGDLIQYTKDGFGRVANINKLASVQGLQRYGEQDDGSLYGLAWDVDLNSYDSFENQEVDWFQLSYGNDKLSTFYRIMHKDGPPIYLYERAGGWISAASAEDITAYHQVGESASKIFALMGDNNPRAIVIIKD